METTNTRNLYNIFGKKVILSVLLLAFCLTANAQSNKENRNFFNFKQKPYYYGLSIGFGQNSYSITHSDLFSEAQLYRRVKAGSLIGFNLNLIGNLKLGDDFDIRALPGFSFSERTLEYLPLEADAKLVKEKRESVYIELPLQVRYKSQPYKDKRAFVIAGIKYGYDVSSNKNSKKSVLRFSPHDFQWEVGMGVQFFFPYFIFSPEIKYSRGIANNLIYDQELSETKALENVQSQIFTLSFHFEG